MQQKKSRYLLTALLFLCSAMLMFSFFGMRVYAEESSEGTAGSDTQAVLEELQQNGSIKLQSGKTYYIERLFLEDGWMIDATGATIISSNYLFNHGLSATNYGSLKNVTIKGGTWKYSDDEGFPTTSIHFTHASNIKLLDMTIENTNYQGHTIELVACKNVLIKNCKIKPLGTPVSSSNEEQIQIDVAAQSTAPFILRSGMMGDRIEGDASSYLNNAGCQNIKIIGCEVTGSRAVCANFTKKDGKEALNSFHSNIVVKNCKLTGETAEALAIFNTLSATVNGNTIITKAPLSRDSYSVGCHFHLFGDSSEGKNAITVSKNTIKGGREGLYFFSHSKTLYNKVTAKNNKLYAKSGAENALKASSVKNLKEKGNKTKKW